MGKHWRPDIFHVASGLKYDPETGHLHERVTLQKPSARLLRWMRENNHPMKQWRKFAAPSDIIEWEDFSPEPVGKPCKRTGALIVYRGNQQFYAHVIVWLKTRGSPPEDGIVHLNGDRTDNRAENLASALELARAKTKPYRARVRTPDGLLHLGYFATVEERDAAIFAYRLGISPNGSKNA